MFIPSVQTIWWQGFVRYASLALWRDMLRVGCNYSGISSMSTIEWPGWLKWEGTQCCCGICVEWIVCCLSMFFKALTKCAFSFTYILFFTSFALDHICQVPLSGVDCKTVGFFLKISTQSISGGATPYRPLQGLPPPPTTQINVVWHRLQAFHWVCLCC